MVENRDQQRGDIRPVPDPTSSRNGCERPLHGPASIQPTLNGDCAYPCQARPFGYAMRRAVKRDHPAGASVFGLLFLGRPFHVAGLVMPGGVVDPVDTVQGRRAPANIRKECIEVVTPCVANRNASTAIIGVMLICRVEAARLDTGPSQVFRRQLSADGFSMAADTDEATGDTAVLAFAIRQHTRFHHSYSATDSAVNRGTGSVPPLICSDRHSPILADSADG